MTLQFLTTAVLLTLFLSCNSQTKPDRQQSPANKNILRATKLRIEELNKLDSAELDFQIRGNCYAFSSPANAEPSNGEAHSPNIAKKIDETFPHQGLYLAINDRNYYKLTATS